MQHSVPVVMTTMRRVTPFGVAPSVGVVSVVPPFGMMAICVTTFSVVPPFVLRLGVVFAGVDLPVSVGGKRVSYRHAPPQQRGSSQGTYGNSDFHGAAPFGQTKKRPFTDIQRAIPATG